MRLSRSLALCTLFACSVFDREAPPPYGEALVVVDTDLPVPRVVSRLRIDLYAEDGTWLTSRDDVRPDPRDWPTSFSVYTDDETRGHVVLVRLRAYPEGRQIRYRGAIRASLPDLLREIPQGDGQPRLVQDGVDRTPELEPDPTLAVDRLVRVRLVPKKRGRIVVVLEGSCAGKVAELGADPKSCVASGMAPIIEPTPEDTLRRDVPSAVGTWGAASCTDLPANEKICVPGGAFIFGDAFFRPASRQGDEAAIDSRPERVVRISRFLVDRDEVSVARFRDALARGFKPVRTIGMNEKEGLPPANPDEACTFSAAPRGREALPLNCIAWDQAQAFCRFENGDLPTEAQWEYVALAATRPKKTLYPWGDDPPTCDRAVYGRSFLIRDCLDRGEGLVTEPADVNVLGVRNLAGGLEEHVRDSHLSFKSDCWRNAPSIDPLCSLPAPRQCVPDPSTLECRVEADGFRHGVRGGSWSTSPEDLRGVLRAQSAGAASQSPFVGFRCVYPAP
jgi:formylglycine-generating enzyme required for sulfatase activity